MKEAEITVHIKYKGIEETFSGNLESVWASLNRFFSQFIPLLETTKKIMLTIDLKEIIENCAGLIAVTSDGAHILVSRSKLTDNETLILNLLAAYIGYHLGLLDRESLSKDELQRKLSKSSKIVSTRLGELVKNEFVEKTDVGEYKITSFGIVQAQREIIPKIKAKLGLSKLH